VDWISTLARHYFDIVSGELRVGGVPVSELVARFGTPVFIYDAAVLDHQLRELREALTPSFDVYYSVKANPNPWILRHFVDRGCGLEIASAGEYHAAVAAGCPRDRILFAGPGKTSGELEVALTRGVGEIHVESPTEIRRVAQLARRLGSPAAVGLRINPGPNALGGALQMGGKSAPFGIDEERLDEAADLVLREDGLRLTGIHLFTGTQILDATVLVRQYQAGIAIARRLAVRLGRSLPSVDLGGGLGIPYGQTDTPLDLTKLREGVAALWTSVVGDRLFDGTRFIVEPGRFLAGPAGIYVTSVVDVKVSRGKTFVVTDGGMNHHLAASGHLGQALRRNFPVAIINRLDCDARVVAEVVGPLCTPLDVLARGAQVSAPEIGDLVGVFQSGAYARSASPLNFLSHSTPPEVLVRDGHAQLIRRRGTPDDHLRDVP